jgi:ATP-dependent DNA helicase RecQ
MRVTCSSLAERLECCGGTGSDPETLIPRACDLLEGCTEFPGIEPDALRDRLLAGYRHILVDEYQDIDADQYRLISTLAGRTPEDAKLTLLAVGNDDQNIYGFRDAKVGYIHRFRQDYQAGEAPMPAAQILELCYETLAEQRPDRCRVGTSDVPLVEIRLRR